MKFQIEGSEFTVDELLHHIGKGNSGHFKAMISGYIESANKRIADLEAEIARRDAAAGEPVGTFMRTVEVEPVKGRIGYSHMKGDEANSPFCFPLYTTPPAPSAPEWSNEQIMEFLAVAFRHGSISGDITMDDIRLGVKMANSAAPGGQ